MQTIINNDVLSESPMITIVIPTYNSMSGNRRIDRLLKSIFNQTYDNFEVIVVDNFSIDGTADICKKFSITFIQEHSTIHEANNIGLENAKGEFIVFLDSDMELPSTYLEECVKLIQFNSVDCINMEFISVESMEPSLLNYVQLRNVELAMGAASLNIYFYSRKIIGDVRFPKSSNPIVGEEYIFRHLILIKGPKIGHVKSPILHYHDPRFEWLIRRSWKYGKWFIETKKHLSIMDN
ncbi:MAG: glycosyltransferase family 2 protein, partial [Candidatus Hodarchaeota archaeon]